jgi:hypothetical protein
LFNDFVFLKNFPRQVNSILYRLAQIKSILSMFISERNFNKNGFVCFELFAYDSSSAEFRNRQGLDSVNVTSTSTKRLLGTFDKSLCKLFLLLLELEFHRVINFPYISISILVGGII